MSSMSLHTGRNDCCPLSDDNTQNGIKRIMVVTSRGIIAETLLGALGNLPLLCHYLLLNCTDGQVRAMNLIFMHLTLSNSLVIVSKGIPQTMATFGLKHIFSDLGCQLLYYVQRVGRSMSIGTTCLLFVFQAIMISPIDSCWNDLKVRIPHYVNISISFYWIFYVVIHLVFPLHKFYVSSKWSLRNITSNREPRYCYMDYNENISVPFYTTLILFPEFVFSGLIVWASGSMILFLHRHKQRVQHIHKKSSTHRVSSRSSAETRVTQRILVLVSTFVCFYTPCSFLSMCLAVIKNQNGVLLNTAELFSLCFPIVSPFLVMRLDPTVSRLSFVLLMTKRSNIHTHNQKTCIF